MELSIQEIRGQLDTIDDQLTALFARRMALAKEVAAYKKANGLPILDTGRERQRQTGMMIWFIPLRG